MNLPKAGFRWSMRTGALAAVVLASWLLPASSARAQSSFYSSPYQMVDSRYFDRSVYYNGQMMQRSRWTSMGGAHLQNIPQSAHANRNIASTSSSGRRGGGGGYGGGASHSGGAPNLNVATTPSVGIPSLGISTSHVSALGHVGGHR